MHVCLGVQARQVDALAEPLPTLDFARSRYGHAFMLAERLGFLYEDLAGTVDSADSGE